MGSEEAILEQGGPLIPHGEDRDTERSLSREDRDTQGESHVVPRQGRE